VGERHSLRSEPANRVTQAGETRSAAVESLRAIAALGVVVAHTYVFARYSGGRQPAPTHGVWQRLVVSGSSTVYIFFALSGYLLYVPFAKQAFTGGRRVDVRRYAANRALRILPLYYVSLLVYMLVQHDMTAHNLLMFGTFSENFSSSTSHWINPVLWTLVLEVQFYVLLPLLAWLVAKAGRGSLGRALAVVAALGLASLTLRWVTLYAGVDTNRLLADSFPSCFVFFAIGMSLALMRLSWERRPPLVLAGPLGAAELWCAGAVVAWLLVAYVDPKGRPALVTAFLLVGAVVLPLRNERVRRVLSWRPLALLGVASYSLYIWHILIIQRLSSHFSIHSFPKLFVVAVPVCIAVAFASYAFVESPFLRLRRGWGGAATGSGAGRSAPAADSKREEAHADRPHLGHAPAAR
jgi:peptidoglycan/LPS O-acetylase OafA/YrhL